MNIAAPGFAAYMDRLGKAAGISVRTFADLEETLLRRMLYFDGMGCRISDHSLDYAMYVTVVDEG